MNRNDVLELLYKKYIEPTKKNRDLFAGIEIELPVINLDKKPVDFTLVQDVTQQFKDRFGFYKAVIDENKETQSLVNFQNDDILSYDCSYNNLELSLGKEADIGVAHKRFTEYYEFLEGALGVKNHTLTGLGINPYRKYNNLVPIPNGRYRMLFHHLQTYEKYRPRVPMFFHPYPAYGMFSSASQVQLDVQEDKLIDTIKAFSLLEPLKAVLFSNSVLTEEHEEFICYRDMFWENSTHGINPHNIGMFDALPESIDELIEYIASTSIYCTEQDSKYINFEPINIVEYFAKEQVTGEYYCGGEYKDITFVPKVQDLAYLRSFKFEDLTFRGTIEFRSVCCQPIRDEWTVSAFHLGLINKVSEVNELLSNDRVLYHRGYTATELRRLLNLRKWPEFVDFPALTKLLLQVLKIAESGLRERGLGEDVYLAPLFSRAERLTNPARELLANLENGVTIETIIEDYAKL
ncbi:MAG: glutamylcysteine synthetase [Clostridiales Family XIII bacterium]|jgi:gamma-glutamylcysteine synthetase|nr:glutamylcysteine synthetase [Clostridiales Family XIII bacterium]